jgi:hypothetical protein
MELDDLTSRLDQPFSGLSDRFSKGLLAGRFPIIGTAPFRDLLLLFVSEEVVLPAVLSKLIDDRGIDDPLDVGPMTIDGPLAADQIPYLDPDILHDVFWIKAIPEQIIFLDVDVQELSIVFQDMIEIVFFPSMNIIHVFSGVFQEINDHFINIDVDSVVFFSLKAKILSGGCLGDNP